MPYSESIEEYVKALCKLGAGQEPVTVGELAEHLSISAVSTHEMVKRLVQQGLATYQPYRGISLTIAGQAEAGLVLRRHRLWERFLHDQLGLSWASVHEEAGRLEHATSTRVAEALAAFLDNPISCPHGYPIEGPNCSCTDEPALRPMTALSIGEDSMVMRVPEEDIDLLSYLDQMGLRPQTALRVVEIAPFEGPLTIETTDQRLVIGYKVASQILVR